MSTPQPLQDRVLEVLNHHGSLPVKDLRRHIADVSAEALDCAVNALQRSNKLTRALGWYDLVREPKGKDGELKRQPKAPEVTVILAPSDLELQLNQKSDALDLLSGSNVTPPTAAEEAESSLAPIEAAYELIDIQVYKQTCIDCENSFPITEFQLIGPHKTRARRCPACHGKRSAAGIAAHKVKRLKGEPLAAATSTLVSDSLHTANGSPSSNSTVSGSSGVDADTLRRHKSQLGCRDGVEQSTCGGDLLASAAEPGTSGGASPPTASAAHRFGPMSLTETQPVQLRPAATLDTSTEATAVGPETSPDKQPPAAADSVAGRSSDSMQLLAEKRAALIARRELLLEEYEANLRIVVGRIGKIDQAMELVRNCLCEETE